ncbi:MAG: hypothetical protein LW847_05885 [Burkholderiales bacterium]|jgi:hypothetical protein|nr:hypothetical protein [Burkholderiales bacterium]
MSAAPWLRTVAMPLAVALLTIAFASVARYRLVESAALTARCDAAPWDGADCTLRTLTIQAFAAQRLGWTAFALGVLATLLRWRALAWAALVAGSAALVLYSAALGAPAALLGALVLVRRAESSA